MAVVPPPRRWRRPSPRALWLSLAALLAFHSLVVSGLTQGPEDAVNVLLVWGGALVVLGDQGAGWRPRPSRVSLWCGMAVVLLVLWRSQQLVTLDAASSGLPLLAGLGLALLAAPARRLGPLRPALVILALLPLMRALLVVIPTERLSLLTARVTQVLLHLGGLSAQVQGNVVRLPDGAVQIAGPCSGIGMVAQLVGVGLIFGLAFPMRHRWQSAVMVVVAPLLAVLANGLRIGLLAVITASRLPGKRWWFDFFHEHEGSLVFSGIAVLMFAWLYGWWMEWQVQQLEGP
ncbi:MAG: exosortase/archaeosortase family protein [Cyanobacteriota bacterium]|nr:exosortase/archaeosortase family protein [Cyanobacteriota bacterium]